MYIIKVKGKDEYWNYNPKGFHFTSNLSDTRVFNSISGAKCSIKALPDFVQRVGLEVVEVEIKIK